MPDLSNPTKPGAMTSEGKMASIVAIAGAVLAGITVTLGSLQASFPSIGWIGVAAGMAAMAASVLGYSKSRATVKSADILADAAKVIAGIAGPAAGMKAISDGTSLSTLVIPKGTVGSNVPPNP